jgi:hypothetical protein
MPKKLGFLQWLLWKDEWKKRMKEYFRDDFFGPNEPINTPLEWSKDIIHDGYRITMDIYKEIIMVLVAALFSVTLWAGLIIREKGAVIDFRYLIAFWAIIFVIWIISHIRMKYKVAIKDRMITVVLEHKCDGECKDSHFPKK